MKETLTFFSGEYLLKQAGTLCAVVFFITLLIESQYDWDGGR
jgi:hypothetical protein